MYLNCHTYYSLKYGSISPNELLNECKNQEIERISITDINNTSATLELIRNGAEKGITVIPGIDFRNGAEQLFVGIAKNNQGFYELNKYISDCSNQKIESTAPIFKNVYVIYPWHNQPKKPLNTNEFIGVRPSDFPKLMASKWLTKQEKLVALMPVTFLDKKGYNIHRLLRAIDKGHLLSQLPKTEEAREDELLLPQQKIIETYAPFPTLIENTNTLLESCHFNFDFEHVDYHNNQQSYTANEDLDFRLIRKLSYDGVAYRFPELTETIKERIEKELTTIRQKGYVSYFLIAWKLLKYARSKNYFYVGRGSGANSVLSYLLRITDVNPIELDLYFERFINLFRQSPPDFDIDFSWRDRADVTQYLFTRFKNVTLLGAYSTFQRKSVIRELSKVFGLPEMDIKKLQSTMKAEDDIGRLVLRYSLWIHGFPSHLTVHSAGIVISEKSIYNYTATFLPPKGFPTTHFDMHLAEDIALHKFDILGQRGLAKIKETLSIIKENRKGLEIDIHQIDAFKKDPKVNALVRSSNAIGCFYVESPAMRMLLSKLQVNDYLGLVAASSVIRPGVAQSGMMREYILRHRSAKRRAYAQETFPVLYQLMPDTYGVMVYQEDVIKVAHFFAGLGLAEADVLRRGMSGKYRSREEFQVVKSQFFENCVQRGYTKELVTDVWRQIESFAGYAFAKGHSASYAVESYQCLFLKAYYPIEFMVANINNGGGFYSKEIYLHEARKYGAIVHLPCVNFSKKGATLKGLDIYLGLYQIHSLEANTVILILEERKRSGLFLSLRDFVNRVPTSLDALIVLIRSGAFHFTEKPKKELLWDVHFILRKTKKTDPDLQLFEQSPKNYKLPKLWQHELEPLFDEMEFLGFPISAPPFALAEYIPQQTCHVSDFTQYVGKIVTVVAYRVHVKRTTTKDGRTMLFGTFLDLSGDWLDTVSFPFIAERYPFSAPGCYLIEGKVMDEFGYLSLEVKTCARIPSKSMDASTLHIPARNNTSSSINLINAIAQKKNTLLKG
ncbi:MAG: DNA-directed DNA polymerase III PolC [Candidatus Azotimanducaceae bacterium]|jgi:DNA-directed DNA polymerase III PolC